MDLRRGTRFHLPDTILARCAALLVVLAGFNAPAPAQSRNATCADCHGQEAQQFEASVHQAVVRCTECHGGQDVYELTYEQWRGFEPQAPGQQPAASRPGDFDHGSTFRGKPARAGVPELCGTCHADVARMNPYGLHTDPLAAYWVSGHGQRLKNDGDDRVAVCIDCHGAHDVISKDDAHSQTYFRNIPETCARCHADQALMQDYGLSAEVPEQYRNSVHGRNVLERGDAGSPQCATCHGSHAAAPPGFAEVGHVCGQCHQQIESYLASSVHGRIAVMARCTGCHSKDGNPRNHRIEQATPPAETLVEVYSRLPWERHDDPQARFSQFVAQATRREGSLRLENVCRYCHGAARQDPHAQFFESSDRLALERGQELDLLLRGAEYEYARTAERVARVARGVLLVRDEALRAEDAKTEVMALYTFMHSLNRAEIQDRVQALKQICLEVNQSLDQKETGLVWRRRALAGVWTFVALFFVLMYRKYLALKSAYVHSPTPPAASVALPTRRRLLDATLRLMGAATLVGLLWPVVAFTLPVRKRGGGTERVTAGKSEGWELWEARKVSVAGKAVAVIRSEKGFQAFSIVCTHLGCIVHWNQGRREFECPCHAARFDAAGQVVSGPPPRPLPEYSVAVAQGEVIVSGPKGA